MHAYLGNNTINLGEIDIKNYSNSFHFLASCAFAFRYNLCLNELGF